MIIRGSGLLAFTGVSLAALPAWAEGGLPQLNIASYPSQIFWLAVSFVLLYIIVSRIALPRISQILQRRMRNIDADYSAARKYRREVETLVGEMDEILAQGRAETQELLRNKHQALQANVSDQQSRAQQEIAAEIGEQEQAIHDAKNDALLKVDEMASELIEKCVVLAGGKKPTKTALKSALKA